MRLLSESNLNQQIGWFHPDYVIYGDPAYVNCRYIASGYAGSQLSDLQTEFNQGMSRARVSVEWAFGCVLNLWNGLRHVKSFRYWLQPVGLYYRVAVLLFNIHNIWYPNQISQFYHCYPMTMEEYMHKCEDCE